MVSGNLVSLVTEWIRTTRLWKPLYRTNFIDWQRVGHCVPASLVALGRFLACNAGAFGSGKLKFVKEILLCQ